MHAFFIPLPPSTVVARCWRLAVRCASDHCRRAAAFMCCSAVPKATGQPLGLWASTQICMVDDCAIDDLCGAARRMYVRSHLENVIMAGQLRKERQRPVGRPRIQEEAGENQARHDYNATLRNGKGTLKASSLQRIPPSSSPLSTPPPAHIHPHYSPRPLAPTHTHTSDGLPSRSY